MTTPNPESSGPPLRAIAMVLIALAILFAGLGAASLGGSDSEETAAEGTPTTTTSAPAAPAAARTTTSAAPVTTTPAAEPSTEPSTPPATSSVSAATTVSVDKSVPVRVFNNSTVTGLAARTASELTSNGWSISETGNYAYGQIQGTTVYYGSSAAEKAAAQAIAAELGVKAEPRFAGIENASPGVIVIVTSG